MGADCSNCANCEKAEKQSEFKINVIHYFLFNKNLLLISKYEEKAVTFPKQEIEIKTIKAEVQEENIQKSEKPKKQQNYEKTLNENIEVKNKKKISNPSLEDVNFLNNIKFIL